MKPTREQLQQRVLEIEQLTTNFCKENLNKEYAQLCRKLINKVLNSDSADILLSGGANTQAAGILQVIAANNFLFRSKTHPVNADKIGKALGISGPTALNKAAKIRKAVKMENYYDPEYSTYEACENNFAVSMRTQCGTYAQPQNDFDPNFEW